MQLVLRFFNYEHDSFNLPFVQQQLGENGHDTLKVSACSPCSAHFGSASPRYEWQVGKTDASHHQQWQHPIGHRRHEPAPTKSIAILGSTHN